MTFEGSGGSEGMSVPPARTIPHYHGRAVRALFLAGAIVLIVGQSTGAELPISTVGSVLLAILLVVAAGITNPTLMWIHWANAILAFFGTLKFGMAAVTNYRAGLGIFDFVYVEAFALISLAALYFTTRTLRGKYLRQNI